jgi:hypothetical protein
MAQPLALALWRSWCFGCVNLSHFQKLYPEIPMGQTDLPSLAILNRNKTSFKLLRNVEFYDDVEWQLGNLTDRPDDPEMTIPLRYSPPSHRARRIRLILCTFCICIVLVAALLYHCSRRASYRKIWKEKGWQRLVPRL